MSEGLKSSEFKTAAALLAALGINEAADFSDLSYDVLMAMTYIACTYIAARALPKTAAAWRALTPKQEEEG